VVRPEEPHATVLAMVWIVDPTARDPPGLRAVRLAGLWEWQAVVDSLVDGEPLRWW
jgi:hypothetical protein